MDSKTSDHKLSIALVCGGKSAEHEVSLASTRNIVSALDRDKYVVHLLMLDRHGRLSACGSPERVLAQATTGRQLAETLKSTGESTAVGDGPVAIAVKESHPSVIPLDGTGGPIADIDVVFPVLHGPGGEDGSIQGLARLANVAVVGCDVLGSAVNMDKDVMKRLLRDADLPVVPWVTLRDSDRQPPGFAEIVAAVGCPFFVKPCNLGSSVGISRVSDEAEFLTARDEAFAYDSKILCETFIVGRELECAVLGSTDLAVSLPGEIVTGAGHDFYTYDAKYLDESGAALAIPADLPPEVAAHLQDLAGRAFVATCCEGMARVDFFLQGDGEAVINELNTIPGFTDASMYPKLMEASGIATRELLDRLIDDALERFERRQRLKVTVS